MYIRAIIFALAVFALPFVARAAQTLITTDPETIVYTGPGRYYRPLVVLPARTELRASSQTRAGRDQSYYRVLIELPNGKKAIGYIPAAAELLQKSDGTPLDLTEYSEISLASDLVSISGALMKSNNQLFMVGYQKFYAPGFYLKGFLGQWRQPSAEALVGGGEIGNDALVYKNISGFISLGLGALSPTSEGSIFSGSSKFNALILGTVGMRYNWSQAAASLGFLQTAAFNSNNSLLSNGLLLSMEIGL